MIVNTHILAFSAGGQIIPVSCEFEQNLFEMKDDHEAQKCKILGSYGIAKFSHNANPFLHSFPRKMHGRGKSCGFEGPAGGSQIDGAQADSRGTSSLVSTIVLHSRTQGGASVDHHERQPSSPGCRSHPL